MSTKKMVGRRAADVVLELMKIPAWRGFVTAWLCFAAALLAIGTTACTHKPNLGLVNADGSSDAGPEAADAARAETNAPSDLDSDKGSNPGFRYLALGDSYTIGEDIDASGRYPYLLTQALEQAGFAVETPPIVARTGWTCRGLASGIEASLAGEPVALSDPLKPGVVYDLVTLLIGVNDQYFGSTPDEVRSDFRQLVETAIQFAGGDPSRVIVVSIPDWGVSPAGQSTAPDRIAREIDAYNEMERSEAADAGVRYVDITPLSRAALGDDTMFAPDGLHPSAAQYAAWTRLIEPVAIGILE